MAQTKRKTEEVMESSPSLVNIEQLEFVEANRNLIIIHHLQI